MGILNPTLEALDDKKAFFKSDFHAMFYCGMSTDHVEILVGFFNIREGSYDENIHLLRYDYRDFAERYLLGMKMFFDTTVLKKQRSMLDVQIEDGEIVKQGIAQFEGSLDFAK